MAWCGDLKACGKLMVVIYAMIYAVPRVWIDGLNRVVLR